MVAVLVASTTQTKNTSSSSDSSDWHLLGESEDPGELPRGISAAQFTRVVRLSVLVSWPPPWQSNAGGCGHGDDCALAGATCERVVAPSTHVAPSDVKGVFASGGCCCTMAAGWRWLRVKNGWDRTTGCNWLGVY